MPSGAAVRSDEREGADHYGEGRQAGYRQARHRRPFSPRTSLLRQNKKKKKIIIFTPNYGPRIRVFWIAMLTPVGSPQPRKRIPADCIPHREQARDADHHGPVQKVSCTVEGEFVS